MHDVYLTRQRQGPTVSKNHGRCLRAQFAEQKGRSGRLQHNKCACLSAGCEALWPFQIQENAMGLRNCKRVAGLIQADSGAAGYG